MTSMLDGLAAIRPELRPGTSVEIAQNLLDFILSSDLRPGDRLPSERTIAETAGLPRSAVREALKSLGFLGLLDVRPGGGTYLRSTESELLPKVIEWGLLLGEKPTRDIIEARTHLEVAVAKLAAARRTEADIDQLRVHIEEMADSTDDPDRFREADIGFHLALTRVSRNVIFQDLLSGMHSLLQVWSSRTLEESTNLQGFYEEHLAVFNAVELGDDKRAGDAMSAHMDAALARLDEVLSVMRVEGQFTEDASP